MRNAELDQDKVKKENLFFADEISARSNVNLNCLSAKNLNANVNRIK